MGVMTIFLNAQPSFDREALRSGPNFFLYEPSARDSRWHIEVRWVDLLTFVLPPVVSEALVGEFVYYEGFVEGRQPKKLLLGVYELDDVEGWYRYEESGYSFVIRGKSLVGLVKLYKLARAGKIAPHEEW